MNSKMQGLLNETVNLEVTGKMDLEGTIIDIGSDTLVVYDGNDYLYIPVTHIQNLTFNNDNDNEIGCPADSPCIDSENINGEFSLKRILMKAVNMFTEVAVIGEQSLYGYITNVKDDYLVFHSPVHKTIYILLDHLKWLIPHPDHGQLYGFANESFLNQSVDTQLASTFENLITEAKGEFVVVNMGESVNHIGKIKSIEGGFIEVQPARASSMYVNMHHIKTLQIVK
ncbi:DUF2642 domain-containing protein [Aciduricibacillus chroicocephali]|uniref:DUF2642 domain-containing protein n=1 Tax=Aciduricibacillus chroicocephali TaxID=3054939 RepID=A0ABY9KSB2_9BACI|nr:DUF2642 domain-containing protein [Bacillaceae bacterium 44XB]